MLKTVIEGTIFSFQLLTTIPLKKQVPYEKEQVRISVMSYPIVGGFLGILIFSLLFVMTEWTAVSPIVLTLLIATITIVYSGGLHLDGWMDASDAFFSYKSRSEKIEIMKDSRIGAFAAISVFLLLAWKLVLIYEVITLLSVKQFIIVALIPFFTRMSLGMKLYFGKLARQEGMAFAMQKYIKKKDSLSYLIMLLTLFLGIIIFFQHLLIYVSVLFLSSVSFYYVSAKIDHHVFGGITGDTLGASVEGGELWLWMTLYLLLSFVMG
ncbi:adenosylcobinamide-GDP ribazoletransferase [Anaerobacillus isosaccharinicus]|uniref:Adenosylcobinamide-GDP ribazoletransferase n=1 Tax=Anaerobacillus isosaccharinicus TaxID=1532552 RepID=A0A1S2M3T1_9BACI|nr:adenosylcobinamide-GDP ribazoletransferase [Anaerobacillus isosaccharinicus]MBA5585791.1 adenosylcobinamide-GDP ribazoletransferase [Anaerobacillus isosaccharinicus]QOY35912.1 adenosylcobinamide-GDP ribazoletransferase [Anaerobacillus isosaccharinicus]